MTYNFCDVDDLDANYDECGQLKIMKVINHIKY